jgi:hypothetical protein
MKNWREGPECGDDGFLLFSPANNVSQCKSATFVAPAAIDSPSASREISDSGQALMGNVVVSKSTIVRLLGGGVLLPIAIVLVVGVAGLLTAMQDLAGAVCLQRIALGLGVVWVFIAICLLLAVAANSLSDPQEPPQ